MKCQRTGCRANSLMNGKLCYFHAPEVLSERKQAQSAGGKARRRIAKADSVSMTMDDIRLSLSKAIRELENSNADLISRCRGIGYLSGVLVTTLQVSDFEARLVELEKNILLSNEGSEHEFEQKRDTVEKN